MTNTHQNQKEAQVLRASAVIVKGSQAEGGTQVLLVQDQHKTEVSAGFKKWHSTNGLGLAFPGATRGTFESGKLQTRAEVLRTGLHRELGLVVSLDFLQKGAVQQYPFLIGRLLPHLIQQIGATSALFYFDELKHGEKKKIDQSVLSGLAHWFSLEEIVRGFRAIVERNGRFHHRVAREMTFRPHVYTTAYLYFIDRIEEWPNEAILREVNKLNMTTQQFITYHSKLRRLPVHGGPFSQKGNITIPYHLGDDDKQFLYNIPQK